MVGSARKVLTCELLEGRGYQNLQTKQAALMFDVRDVERQLGLVGVGTAQDRSKFVW